MIDFVNLLEVNWSEFIICHLLILLNAHITNAQNNPLRVINEEYDLDANIDHKLQEIKLVSQAVFYLFFILTARFIQITNVWHLLLTYVANQIQCSAAALI